MFEAAEAGGEAATLAHLSGPMPFGWLVLATGQGGGPNPFGRCAVAQIQESRRRQQNAMIAAAAGSEGAGISGGVCELESPKR